MAWLAVGVGSLVAITACSDDAAQNATTTAAGGSLGEGGAGATGGAVSSGGAGGTGAVGGAGGSGGASVVPPDPSAGCLETTAGYPAGTTTASIDVGAATRTFRVHVPPGYQPGDATPVVVMLHGGGGSGQQFQTASSRMDQVADAQGFITVYPDGTGVLRTWNGGLCCGKAVEDDVDDVGFIDALLDHLDTELCVDRRRVFASGMSNGGIMSHRLGCELSNRIAAIAPVAGTIGVSTCTPTRPVPVMHIHGTLDGHVPWNGGVGCGPAGVAFESVPNTIDGWTSRNGCGAATATYLAQGDGTCSYDPNCAAPVVLCSIDAGGHSWPGGDPSASVIDCPADGEQSTTFSASEAMWSFFAEHPRAD